jgi:hypothetical protein
MANRVGAAARVVRARAANAGADLFFCSCVPAVGVGRNPLAARSSFEPPRSENEPASGSVSAQLLKKGDDSLQIKGTMRAAVSAGPGLKASPAWARIPPVSLISPSESRIPGGQTQKESMCSEEAS